MAWHSARDCSVAAIGLYERRFSEPTRRAKAGVWKVLCEDFLQRYVRPEDTVLDLGAGFCEFINHIRCARKWAVDVDEDVRTRAAPDVGVRCAPARDLGWLAPDTVNVVFASNVFEHLSDKEEVIAVLGEVRRVLVPGGRLLVLQPNIRFAYREYWDFFDHHLPFSDRAMVEGLESSGFAIESVRPRFLPFTTKGRLPSTGKRSR